ncbi:MAG: hypothetical protein NC388_10185 [Clostridium sp.]|nr:hypothetical protein [Clostridium sp.]
MKKFFYAMMACAVALVNVACSEDDENLDGGNGGGGAVVAEQIAYSFTQKACLLGESTELTVELRNKQGQTIVADEDIPVTLLVDEATTAVEGVNFEVVSKTATVAKGSYKCTFTLKSIVAPAATAEEDDATEEPGNTIVLGLQFQNSEKYTFLGGAYPKTTVSILGSMVNDLYGTWVMNELRTDKDYMDGMWGGMATYEDGFPAFEAADKFIFEDGVLKTELVSDLKNYFQPESEFVFAGERPADKNTGVRPIDSFQPIALQQIELKNVNRYFSASETSEDKVALLGMRNITDDNGETLLDVYLFDYESHSFAVEMMDYGMYEASKPTAWQSGMYINFTLKKAN